MSHQARAIVLHCIDFRFVQTLHTWLRGKGYEGQYDLVSVVGAVKNIVDPYNDSDPEFVYRQIEIARKLHGIGEVILINHTDCGAYGGRRDFASLQEERDRHAKDLQRAKVMIEHRFADDALKVTPVLADLRDGGIIVVDLIEVPAVDE
ncbi:MAG: hypothetical protein HY340_02570 [Candidatus Kerfeldbacteria bacterium]|nr:hypothetical protein [Candidatus Kerfeldbacteria bacterium]